VVSEGRVPGEIEKNVRENIERLGKLDEGMRSSYALMAYKLARALDSANVDDVAELTKLNQELRQTLGKLVDVGTNDAQTLADLLRQMSTPVRD
jgi:hypothetical protein